MSILECTLFFLGAAAGGLVSALAGVLGFEAYQTLLFHEEMRLRREHFERLLDAAGRDG